MHAPVLDSLTINRPCAGGRKKRHQKKATTSQQNIGILVKTKQNFMQRNIFFFLSIFVRLTILWIQQFHFGLTGQQIGQNSNRLDFVVWFGNMYINKGPQDYLPLIRGNIFPKKIRGNGLRLCLCSCVNDERTC